MSTDNIIELSHIDKAFGGLKILKDVNLNIKRGEKMALIGPNGAGKSTLLNTIGGQGPATAGTIMFNVDEGNGKITPHDITHMAPNQRLHLGLGKSFQVNNLFWQMNLMQNVQLALFGSENKHHRLISVLDNRKDLIDKAEELLKIIDLWDKRDESPTLLSYGEQRMFEMLLAYASNPSIVLLDEPSAGLPTAEVGAFTETLRKLNGDRTMLFVAHDMDLVFNLADSISVLYFGQIIAQGTPEEIANNPKVQEIYLGSDDDSTYDGGVNDILEKREAAEAAAEEAEAAVEEAVETATEE